MTATEGVHLANEAASADPAAGLRAVRALQELADRLEAGHVARARELGWSWQEIASCIGVTRQAVHKKYAHLESKQGKSASGRL